nr:D-lactate dehydrogenase [cytochrome], mitochondrial-like [Tanacetum cinerariifolium]
FWAGRKNAFPAVGRLSPDYYCMDGTIPRRELPGVLKGISALSEEYGLRVANVFHAGDGNMHPLILFDANQPGELDRAEALGGKILELCVKVGGSITGEHGVGREKINQMCAQFNSDELTLFHAVKAAFDPAGTLNPGKNIPTLHRCAEFGAMHDRDASDALLEQVNQAIQLALPLRIQGANSKAFLGREVAGEVLDTRAHCGIVSYDPTELVITARAGTPLSVLNAALEQAGQMLPCEPPTYSDGGAGDATVGGMVAAGLSGPRRPWSGSVRDFVLGTRVITGLGKHLRFGGEVMKNVAGYDVSRLMAGSFGCLGLITEVSLKVLPRPRLCTSIALEMDSTTALARLAQWGQEPLPISAASHDGRVLRLRLEGGEGSVAAAHDRLGGESIDPA